MSDKAMRAVLPNGFALESYGANGQVFWRFFFRGRGIHMTTNQDEARGFALGLREGVTSAIESIQEPGR